MGLLINHQEGGKFVGCFKTDDAVIHAGRPGRISHCFGWSMAGGQYGYIVTYASGGYAHVLESDLKENHDHCAADHAG